MLEARETCGGAAMRNLMGAILVLAALVGLVPSAPVQASACKGISQLEPRHWCRRQKCRQATYAQL